MTSATKSAYAGYRFPGEVISQRVGLYFRFPLSLRMVEEMLAARGIEVSHETVRQWGRKFGQAFANQIRRKLPCPGDKCWDGTVNLIGSGRDTAHEGRAHEGLCPSGHAGDRGPGLEGLGPGGSILAGGEVIAAEMEQVVDLIVSGEEALGLAG